ncbi:MAG: multicopper oxidase domain-containing protein [Actinobacteria bacterium]|nr:multicopper oxidase domain-containing protein [Actinomycetota bacterium]
MRIAQQHRRLPLVAGALATALAMGVTSMVVAANVNGVDTIESRLLDVAFTSATDPADYPVQQLDPASLCLPGTAVSCELWAKEAPIDIPGLGTVTVWGFATTVDGLPQLPGPTIVATAGDAVSVLVHNQLPTSAGDLGFTARSMQVAERNVVPTGTDATYTFTAGNAGTSVYSASELSPQGARQIAMGLAGTVVVRPNPAGCALGVPQEFMGCAYGDPLTGGNGSAGYSVGTDTFHGEAILATNEIDMDLAADPLGFDMTNYRPDAHLVNGRAYPATQVIDGFPGANILLRYVNLGLADHSMGLVGAHQRTIGRDGEALVHGSDDVTVPLNVGQTADVMVQIPLESKAGFRYALADQSRQPGQVSADPALTFLTVWGPVSVPGQPVGEVNIAAGDDETNGGVPMPFTYTVPAGTTAAQWSIDDPGVVTTTLDLSGADVVDVATLSGLVNGSHILWVQWSTDGATYGDPAGIAFTIDRAGPAISPVDVDPIYSNGSEDVVIGATADSTLTGTGLVTDAVYSIDQCPDLGAGGVSMFSNGPGPVVAVTAAIPAVDVAALAEGRHEVNVQAMDQRGMWSNIGDGVTPLCGIGELVVDKSAPTVSAGDVSPNDNDGTMAFPTVDTYLPVVRITAHLSDPLIGTDPGSGIAEVEGFIDDGQQTLPLSAADNGNGFLFTPVDGNLDSPEEDVYADIPLASVASLTPGDHDIWIHGRDLAGNWGAPDTVATTLRTVNSLPRVTDVFVTGPDVIITGQAFGTGVTITGGTYTIGAVTTAIPMPAGDPTQSLNVTLSGITIGAEENIAVTLVDSLGQSSPVAYGKPVLGTLTLAKVPNGPNPNRQRLTGTVVPATGGEVDRIEWSVGSAAAPGTGTSVNLTSTSFNVLRNSGWGPTGTQVWVRAHDPVAGWGPAAMVQVPA